MKAIFQNSPVFTKILIAISATVSIFFIVLFIGMLASVPLFGLELTNLQSYLENGAAANPSFLKFFQFVQSFGIFIIPPFVLGYLFLGDYLSYLKLNSPTNLKVLALAFASMIVAIPLINFLSSANIHLLDSLLSTNNSLKIKEEQLAELTKTLLSGQGPVQLLTNVLILALIPGLGEELLFRGVVQRLFGEWFRNIHVAVFASAILFSAMHLQFYGFLPRFAMGLFLGYLLVWTGSIWIPIIAHFANNFFAVMLYHWTGPKYMETTVDKIGVSLEQLPWLIASILLLTLCSLAIIRTGHGLRYGQGLISSSIRAYNSSGSKPRP